jgi:hypothetical protein
MTSLTANEKEVRVRRSIPQRILFLRDQVREEISKFFARLDEALWHRGSFLDLSTIKRWECSRHQ